MNDAADQNEKLLHHVEEMESMLENLHIEKEELNEQIEQFQELLKEQQTNNESKNNSDSLQNDIAILEETRDRMENMVQDFKAEYQKLKAKQEHDRKMFE